MKPTASPQHRRYSTWAVYGILLILIVGLMVKERASFGLALDAMQQADIGPLVLGVLALLASVPASAMVYMALSPKRLPFGRTTLVQAAGLSVNKVLPSGSGAIGTSFLYLKANKVPAAQAGTVVLTNNLLGFAGHLLLLGLLVLVYPETLDALSVGHDTAVRSAQLFALAVVMLIGLAIVLRTKFARFTKGIKPVFAHPVRIAKALGFAMLITLSYTCSLWAAAESVDVHLTLVTALVVLSGSVLATAAVPTPGGIGAAEAGAYAGLMALNIDKESALAVALLFRVCTFWVPLLIGSVALTIVAKRGYLKS